MSVAKVNGINFFYEVLGSGKPLVIINGLAIDISDIRVISEPLAKTYKVLVFDNRGAGRSDKPDEPYSIEQMARDTAGVMKAAGFKKANILGISMGGRIALELTLSFPELVDKLVLVSTAAYVIRPRTFRNFLGLTVMPRLPIMKGKYPQPHYAYLRQRAASSSYNCLDRLSEIHAPTLICHGERDGVMPLSFAVKTHEGIKGSELKTFTGGHLFFLFRSRQQFLDTVNEYLLR